MFLLHFGEAAVTFELYELEAASMRDVFLTDPEKLDPCLKTLLLLESNKRGQKAFGHAELLYSLLASWFAFLIHFAVIT